MVCYIIDSIFFAQHCGQLLSTYLNIQRPIFKRFPDLKYLTIRSKSTVFIRLKAMALNFIHRNNVFHEYVDLNKTATLCYVAQSERESIIVKFVLFKKVSDCRHNTIKCANKKRQNNHMGTSLLVMIDQGMQLSQSYNDCTRSRTDQIIYVDTKQDMSALCPNQPKAINIIVPMNCRKTREILILHCPSFQFSILILIIDVSRKLYLKAPFFFVCVREKEKSLDNDKKELAVDIKSDVLKCQQNPSEGKKGDTHPKKRFMCAHCNKELFNSTGLKHHTYTHTNAWPFRCSWPGCHKGTATKRDLVKHQRIHNGLSCFVQFTFFFVRVNPFHIIISGERPFECDICNKKFTQSGVMNRHKKVCAKKLKTNKQNMLGKAMAKSFDASLCSQTKTATLK
ncbi:zinc finger protein [Reticulomyxa filosa]|uniref:Zinc finger protein n=1 Tax=Reticulomyxa filosa TaxID=46433 RepID=X6PAT4_RETFI|nr:zinc finger protein [Reticulomyxa filosa]|eukprot:ETO35261.1 zinc finger protein [Reticulomyxa filosa]